MTRIRSRGKAGSTAASLKCLSVSNAEQIRFGSVSYPLARDSLSLSLSISAYNSMKNQHFKHLVPTNFPFFGPLLLWQRSVDSLHTYLLFALIFVCTVMQQSHCNDIWRFPWLSQEVAPPPPLYTPHDAADIMHVKTAQKRHSRHFITARFSISQRFSVFWIFLENRNWRRVSYAILLWTVLMYTPHWHVY